MFYDVLHNKNIYFNFLLMLLLIIFISKRSKELKTKIPSYKLKPNVTMSTLFVFCSAKMFLKKFEFFKIFIFMFLNSFDVIVLKINYLKKIFLKSNHYHNTKHAR